MTAPAFPSITPSQSSSKQRKNKVLISQFGQGFTQYANDGPNSQYDEWQLTFENLTSANRSTLSTFYETNGCVTWFSWTAPGDASSKKWRIVKDTYSESVLSGSLYTISFTVQQCFDLGT